MRLIPWPTALGSTTEGVSQAEPPLPGACSPALGSGPGVPAEVCPLLSLLVAEGTFPCWARPDHYFQGRAGSELLLLMWAQCGLDVTQQASMLPPAGLCAPPSSLGPDLAAARPPLLPSASNPCRALSWGQVRADL